MMRTSVLMHLPWVCFVLILFPAHWARAASLAETGSEITSDFKYLANNSLLDAEDVITSPLYIASPQSPIFNPKFYLVLGGAGALWGGSYALDPTMHNNLRSMGHNNADLLQNISYASVSASTVALYGWGLYSGDDRARHDALTAGMGAGIATILDIGVKAAFGRLRPSQSPSHTQFFRGGQSFVSGDVTPMFGLAAGVSDYFDNRPEVAIPVFSLALLDGFGSMGNDKHWFSDVVGAALLGTGTTELLLWLHRKHEEEPTRWRLFAASDPGLNQRSTISSTIPMGMGASYNW
jgi:membrane-associated phospholipid phosphatase